MIRVIRWPNVLSIMLFLPAFTWLAALSPAGEIQQVFPHLATGGGIRFELFLHNVGDQQVKGSLHFRTPQGKPLPIGGANAAGVLDFSMAPGGVFFIETSDAGDLTAGYALVVSESTSDQFQGSVIFSFAGSQVTIPAQPVGLKFRAVIENAPDERSAVAVVNLEAEPASISLQVLDSTGLSRFAESIELGAGEQSAQFLEEIFAGLDAPLVGSLLLSADSCFSAMTVRQHAGGALAVLGSRLDPQVETPRGPELFSGERALAEVARQVEQGARPTGSAELARAGDLIQESLRQLGWAAQTDLHTLEFGTLFVPVRNIVASLGSGPAIILAAHYDSRIQADRDPDPARRDEAVIGANDGGSGVGVLLELARVISRHYRPQKEIRLLFFDAEDNGQIPPWSQTAGIEDNGWIIGSTLYAQSLDLEESPVDLMILVDMVGDSDQRFPFEQRSLQSAPEVAQDIWDIAAELGYQEQFPQVPGSSILDDHVPFIRRGIPSVDIIDLDYPFWHTTADTLDKVSAESLERVGRVLQTYLERTGAIVKRSSD